MQGRPCSRPLLPSHRLITTVALIAAALLPTALSLLPAPTHGASPPRIPSDISQWQYKPGPAGQYDSGPAGQYKPAAPAGPHQRLWDRSMLRNAAWVTSYEQMRPMLAKLNAGQPVTVVAFGDSITGSFGGCFHRDLEHRKRHVAFMHRPDELGFCNALDMPWLTNFLAMINATWPHPDHLLINLGRPGSSFYTTESDCLELYVPQQIDLLILEHLPHLEPPNSVIEMERLLHRLWLHGQPLLPAVVFLNLHLAVSAKMSGDARDNCIRDMSRCSAECPTSFQGMPHPASLFTPAELQTHSVASYYGMASISHPTLIQALLRHHVPGGAGGMTECEVWGTLYSDGVHPNATGRLLLTDLLVNYLASAEEYFVAQAAEPSHSHGLEGRLLPLQPLDPDSFLVPRMHCFYSAAASGEDHAGGLAGSVPVMKMDKADGWAFVERDGESQKLKPGWVATSPGALLWISLPLDFPASPTRHARALSQRRWAQSDVPQAPELPDGGNVDGSSAVHSAPAAPGDRLSIILIFLRSYKHMGKAEVTCLEGCSCPTYELDGHEPHLTHSIPMIMTVEAAVTTAHAKCVLQVKVLQDSSSGRHKVKVIQVSVGALVDMSQELTALVHSATLQS